MKKQVTREKSCCLLPKQGVKTMLDRKLLLRISVIVLLFGMTVVCEAQNNSGIEGIWDFTKDDGDGILKFEKGKLLTFDDDGEFVDEYSFTIKGNTLTFDGDVYKFSIKGNTLTLIDDDGETMIGTKITESQSPVGMWVPVRGNSAPSGFPDKLELTNDGTGIGDGMGLSWKVDNSRIIFNFGVWGAKAYYYIIYKSNLFLTNDDGRGVGYKKGR